MTARTKPDRPRPADELLTVAEMCAELGECRAGRSMSGGASWAPARDA
jgi:hypothetical protein